MAAAPERLRAEAVVVGTGAGGAPAAAVLAEAGLEVLVLEAGPRVETRDFRDDEWAMRRRLGRITTSADALQSFYAGACVGGSTVVNDALCWRTPPEVLEAWRREHRLEELTEAAFAPYLDRVWHDIHAEPTRRDHLNRNAHHLELGARRLGWAAEAMPRNVRGCANLGRCNLGCPIDAKQSTRVSYLPRAERAGARVLADVRADRVRIEAGSVTGLEATRLDPARRAAGGALQIDAPLVCLAAGVLETGPLLLRSGLGGRAGLGFQAHSSVYVTARFREPVHGYFGPTMAYAVSEFSDVNGRSGPGYMLENAGVRPLQTASVLPGFGVEHERPMAALAHLAHTVVVLRDRSRGALRVGSGGGSVIEYALGTADLERLRHAIARAARAYLAADAEEVWLPLHAYGPVRSEADLARLADFPIDRGRLALLYAVHLFGGATMGGSPEISVCAVDGACWGAKGLYVTDASSLPTNTGVNPQVTIMANALRIAERAAAARSVS